jgi:hypothetical protein
MAVVQTPALARNPVFVSRAELFDLVWSQPRTALAERFKVSDVAVGKKCRLANIPMPPPGYWARVAAGVKPERPALPLRLPGQAEMLTIGEARYASSHEPSEDVPQPPSFADGIDPLVDAAVKQIGRVRAQRDLVDAHRGLARILRKEQQRQQKFSETKWLFDAPRYDDPLALRQLRLYSALFRAFSKIGTNGTVSEQHEWKQGVGHTWRLTGGVPLGGGWTALSFATVPVAGKAAGLKLLVGGDSEVHAHSVWSDRTATPLERQLDAIVRAILVCAEQRLRDCAQQTYEWRVEQRERRAREEQDRLRAEEALRAAQAERELKARREAVYAAATRHRRSMEIRELVAALAETHPHLAADTRFASWCEFALREADRIDPVRTDWTRLLDAVMGPTPDLRTGSE